MEPNKFDDIIKRATTTKLTRLETLRGLAAGAVAAVTGAAIASTDADAKKGKSAKSGKAKNGKAKNGKAKNGNGHGGKVKFCHRTGNGKYETIEVSVNASKAHRDHGDYEGACKPDNSTCGNYNECQCGCCTNYKCICPTTPTTVKPTTTTTPKCIPDGHDCKEKDKHKCCSGCWHKGKCRPCPTTTTTVKPTTTTTVKPTTTTTVRPPDCYHSANAAEGHPQPGCMERCQVNGGCGQACNIACAPCQQSNGGGAGNRCPSPAFCDAGCFKNCAIDLDLATCRY